MQKSQEWAKKNWFVIFFTSLFIGIAVIRIVPYHFTWFELQRELMQAGMLLTGVLDFPLLMISLLFSFLEWSGDEYLRFIGLPIIGYFAATFYQWFWQQNILGKLFLSAGILFNVLFGMFGATAGNIQVIDAPEDACEVYFSEGFGVKILPYYEYTWLPGSHYFFLSTFDNGESWSQIYHIRIDDAEMETPDCSRVQSEGGLIWMWNEWSVMTTNNQGKNWHLWEWECCTYGAVEDVVFIDELNGRIRVHPWRSDIHHLLTSDGGKTWKTQ